MERIAKFEKVSYKQFKKDWVKAFGVKYKDLSDEMIENIVKECYDNIELPKRATTGSAAYDFFLPFNITIGVDESVNIPTGIRCKMKDGWVLNLYPRSGHGFKYGVRLANSVGVVDSDYFYSDNEGHIHVKLVNESILAKEIRLEYDDAFCQGMFVPFGITEDDNVTEKRNGGFGSTDKK